MREIIELSARQNELPITALTNSHPDSNVTHASESFKITKIEAATEIDPVNENLV